MMSIRLAVLQRQSQPLDGLRMQLQCAGYEVLARDSKTKILELLEFGGCDLLLVDGDIDDAEPLISEIRAHARFHDLPIMLIVEETSAAPSRLSIDRVDDIVILPIFHDELRDRVRNLARLTAVKAELDRRIQLQSDFGIDRPADSLTAETTERLGILLVGPADDDQAAIVDLLGHATTINYARSTGEAVDRLRQCYADIVLASGDTITPDDLMSFCQEIAMSPALADLPIVLLANPDTSSTLESICRDCQIDLLRLPVLPIATGKRLRVLARQRRLKWRLRGMKASNHMNPTMDGLTGLYSHSYFYHYLDRSIVESSQRGLPLSLIAIHVVGLDDVNRALGFPIGDQLIAHLAMAVFGGCRAQDLIARERGATMCVVLNDTAVLEAKAVAERLRQILQDVISSWTSDAAVQPDVIIISASLSSNDNARTLTSRVLRKPSPRSLRRAS